MENHAKPNLRLFHTKANPQKIKILRALPGDGGTHLWTQIGSISVFPRPSRAPASGKILYYVWKNMHSTFFLFFFQNNKLYLCLQQTHEVFLWFKKSSMLLILKKKGISSKKICSLRDSPNRLLWLCTLKFLEFYGL